MSCNSAEKSLMQNLRQYLFLVSTFTLIKIAFGTESPASLKHAPLYEEGSLFHGILSFNGSNPHMIPNEQLPALEPDGATFTIAAAIFILGRPSESFRTIFWKGQHNNDRTPSMWLMPGGNRVTYRVSTASAHDVYGESVAELPSHEWCHLALTCDESRVLSLYINGELDSSIGIRGAIIANNGSLHVGKDPTWPGLEGFMAQLLFIRTALTPNDVAHMASQSRALLPSFTHARQFCAPSGPRDTSRDLSSVTRDDALGRGELAEEDIAGSCGSLGGTGNPGAGCQQSLPTPFEAGDGTRGDTRAGSTQDAAAAPACQGGPDFHDEASSVGGAPKSSPPGASCRQVADARRGEEAIPGHAAATTAQGPPRTFPQEDNPMSQGDTAVSLPQAHNAGGGNLGGSIVMASGDREAEAESLYRQALAIEAWGWQREDAAGADASQEPAYFHYLPQGDTQEHKATEAAAASLPSAAADSSPRGGSGGTTRAKKGTRPWTDHVTDAMCRASRMGSVSAAKALAFWATSLKPGSSSYDSLAADDTALFYLLQAAAHGRVDALLALGWRHLHGLGGAPRCHEAAIFYYKRVALLAEYLHVTPGMQHRVEHVRLSYALRHQRQDHKGAEDDANTYLLLRADNGDPAACLALAQRYYWGTHGLPRDLAVAFQWFHRAHVGGHVGGTISAAKAYLKGEGVVANVAAAARLFHVAAEKRHVEAYNGLGYIYYFGSEALKQQYQHSGGEGRGATPQLATGPSGASVTTSGSPSLAAVPPIGTTGSVPSPPSLLSSSSSSSSLPPPPSSSSSPPSSIGQGDGGYGAAMAHVQDPLLGAAQGQAALGTPGSPQEPNEVVHVDRPKALVYFKLAARSGSVDGAFNAGRMMRDGEQVGVVKDREGARVYFRHAALQGHFSSQLALGLMALEGGPGERDEAQAAIYLGAAAEVGPWAQGMKRGLQHFLAGRWWASLREYSRLAEMGYLTARVNVAWLAQEMLLMRQRGGTPRELASAKGLAALLIRMSNYTIQSQPGWPGMEAMSSLGPEQRLQSDELPLAHLQMGDCHFYGHGGCALNLSTAMEHYTMAAAKHSPQALFNLATIYERGLGDSPAGAPNTTAALHYYWQCYLESKKPLMRLVSVGAIVKLKVSMWWIKALEQGMAMFSRLLGNMR
eukprot:jgi/Mesvir1/8210/Mv12501-RA.1